jgi:CIC family chloride channel protein
MARVSIIAARLRYLVAFVVTRLRNSPTALLVWSAIVGFAAGSGVAALRWGVDHLRAVTFGLPPGGYLSNSQALSSWRIVLVPTIGGAVIGLFSWLVRRLSRRELVDAIEANALYGGRMSLRDSLLLGFSTMLSGGFGASVGLEAGFTQVGAALGSRLGKILRLRRDDVRTLVACGAAGGIAAAFNAPLAGAFYAFELILGSYAPASLGAVAVAGLVGTVSGNLLMHGQAVFSLDEDVLLRSSDYFRLLLLGLGAAGFSILVMRGVTLTEQLFRRNAIPSWARPALGGLVLGMLALKFPAVLGSGHGAILAGLSGSPGFLALVSLLVAKALASAISIGSGFRGGLFSSSLLLGSLFGSAVAEGLNLTGHHVDYTGYALVGMASVAAGIVGAPVGMILLVLETTQDFSATIGVTIGVIASSFAVRQWFGYSFATWRFHVRGLGIASPEDIGWINELTVGRLMMRNPPTVPGNTSLKTLSRLFPPGSAKHVFAIDSGGALLGLVDLAEALDPARPEKDEGTVSDFVTHGGLFLLPQQNIKSALNRLRETALESLPVVNNDAERRVLGELTEANALRRYMQELERRKGLETDTSGIFSPVQPSDTMSEVRPAA